MATPRWETSLRRRPDLYSQRRASRGQPGYPFPNRTTGDGGRRQMSDPPSYWPLHSLLRRVTRCAVTDGHGQVLRIEKSNWRSHSIDHCIGAVEPLAEIDIKFSCNWEFVLVSGNALAFAPQRPRLAVICLRQSPPLSLNHSPFAMTGAPRYDTTK